VVLRDFYYINWALKDANEEVEIKGILVSSGTEPEGGTETEFEKASIGFFGVFVLENVIGWTTISKKTFTPVCKLSPRPPPCVWHDDYGHEQMELCDRFVPFALGYARLFVGICRAGAGGLGGRAVQIYDR
jgi:hypothetical protein